MSAKYISTNSSVQCATSDSISSNKSLFHPNANALQDNPHRHSTPQQSAATYSTTQHSTTQHNSTRQHGTSHHSTTKHRETLERECTLIWANRKWRHIRIGMGFDKRFIRMQPLHTFAHITWCHPHCMHTAGHIHITTHHQNQSHKQQNKTNIPKGCLRSLVENAKMICLW